MRYDWWLAGSVIQMVLVSKQSQRRCMSGTINRSRLAARCELIQRLSRWRGRITTRPPAPSTTPTSSQVSLMFTCCCYVADCFVALLWYCNYCFGVEKAADLW